MSNELNPTSLPSAPDPLMLPTMMALYKAKQAKQKINPLGLINALERVFDPERATDTPNGDRLSLFQRHMVHLIDHTLIKQGHVRQATSSFSPTSELSLSPKGERWLARIILNSIDTLQASPDRENGRVSETTLKGPALFLLLKMGLDRAMEQGLDVPQPVKMTELRPRLRALVPKSPEDLAPLAGRSDTRVDQVIRNMISNNSLTDYDWVKRVPGGLQITETGMREVLNHLLRDVPTPPAPGQALAADRPTQPAVTARRRTRPR